MAVELGEGYVSLIPSAKGFTNKIQSELGDPLDRIGHDAGERTSKGFVSRFTSGLGGIALAVGGAFAAVQIGGFLKDSVKQASDLSESVSKVGIVFGDSAGEIKDWAKTAATSLGTSSQQALEAAGTFGNLFVSMKIATPQAAKMSKKMIELAGDLASFNNVSPEEALDALRSGLVGETEPLRRFGVNLNEATLKAKAMELGLSDGKATLDASAKAQASYALILEQTGTAQGDFARTSDGLANQQRILAAQFLDLKAKIGKEFEPAVVAVAKVLTTQVIPAFSEFVGWVGPKTKAALDSFKAEFDGIGLTPEGFFARLGDAAGIVVRLFKDEVPGAVSALVTSFRIGDGDITSSGLAGHMEEIGNKLRTVVDLVKDNPNVFGPIIAGLTGFAAALAAVVAAQAALGVIGPLIHGLDALSDILPFLISPVGLFALAIAGLAAAAFLAYQKIPLFRDAVDSVVKVFKEKGFAAAVTEAGVQVGRLWDVVKPHLEAFVGKIGPWLREHAPGILEGLKSAWVGFATFMGTEFWPFLVVSLGTLLAQFGGWIVDTAAPWLRDKLVVWAQAFAGWVLETAWPWLRDELPKLVTRLGDWVLENKPLIIAKLTEWANAFADWVQNEAIPKLQEKLPGILAAIASWVFTVALPQLLIFGAQMSAALLRFAVLAAAGMPAELARITAALFGWAFDLLVRMPAEMAKLGREIIRALVNPIIRGWNNLSFTLPEVDTHIPGVGKIGGWTLNTSNIPELAGGGVATRPTLALIGERSSARNPEIVAPESTIARVMEEVLARVNRTGDVVVNALTNANAYDIAREVSWLQRTSGR